MNRINRHFAFVFALLAALPSCVADVRAADDFAHLRESIQTIYPNRAAIMNAMALEKEVILLAEAKDANDQPTGRFDFCVDNNCAAGEAGNSQWGAVALLAYWWAKNGQNDQTVAEAARRGLNFALANRNWTDDPADTRYLRLLGSGDAYARFYLNNCKPIGNYPSTAWVLLYKALILKHAPALFSEAQKAAVEAQARSNWNWLSRASKYNPQNTANQTMGAILGAYLLGDALGDPNLKAEAIAYYETGVDGTNLPTAANCGGEPFCGGFRGVARLTLQGRQIFNEQGGFDTHYGAMHLSFSAALFFASGADLASNVYLDALDQAQYVRDRLSESGNMHGGTRHNEMGGSNTDIAFALGLNFFSNKTNSDLGRTRVRNGAINPNSPTQAMAYGQRAMSIILFHEYFTNWNTNKLVRNTNVGVRRGDVSIFFDQTNQPQEVSVGGTSFTETVVQNGVHARGVYLQKADGAWVSDQSTHSNSSAATANYTIRTANGTMADPSVSVKTRYITNGETLYVVNLIKFNAAATLRSANLLIGLPNLSRTKRLVRVYDAADAGIFLDLSSDSGSLVKPKVRTGDVEINGFPEIRVNNASDAATPAKARWMTGVNWNLTIEDLGKSTSVNPFDPAQCRNPPDPGDTPRVWWSPKGSEPTVRYTDLMRVHIKGSSTGDAYEAGDVIVAVAKFAPAGNADGFTVTPTYKAGSSFKVTKVLIKDAKMTFDFGWANATFTDETSHEVVNL